MLAISTAHASSAAQAQEQPSPTPIIVAPAGKLQGIRAGAVDKFLGVPYAQPPAGELRWRAPRPLARWRGVRKAVDFGPSCYQEWPPRPFGPYTSEFIETPRHAEDCLYLNVWAPAKRGELAPILVWIHGGGFGGGSGAVPIYDGTHLASQGVVVVTLNYRVGPFGFLAHPELTREAGGTGVGNYGLQDMIAALRWLQQNAAAFGGDKAQVTIAGQSAGAMAINDLLVSPQAARLFARAIAQSGIGMGINAIPLPEAERNGVAFLSQVGARSLAELRALPPEKIQAAIPTYFDPAATARPRIPFRPVLDGAVIPADPIDGAVRPATVVPTMVGYNYDEFMPTAFGDRTAFDAWTQQRYGAHAERLLALYPQATLGEANDSARQLTRDTLMTALTLWSERRSRHGAPVFVYYYQHPAPVATGPSYGTFHTSEVPYVFGVLNRAHRPYTAADEQIAAQLQSYWLSFIRTGDPNGEGRARWDPIGTVPGMVMGLGDSVGPRRPASSTDRFQAIATFVRERDGLASP